MKKLFRFKYEPCNGTCYAYDDIFYSEMKKLDNTSKSALVDIVVKAHDKLCDNPSYYFGLDLCQETNIFIGHFVQPSRVDIFTGETLEKCVLKLSRAVISTNIPQLDGTCEFGNNGQENLAKQILEASAS